MIKNADKIGGGTTALYDKRITKFGNVLRKTKLDEIPQLINIIFGSMSFIGPRPELLQYTTMYNEVEKYILKVRPGITDFSSLEFINLDEIVGSNNPDKFYEENILNKKNNLRLKYIFNLSLKTDIKIFVFTIVRVLEKIFRVIWRIIWKKSK
jgi:lipopolysaccharide/colanic/teichoic acid biosynthesis glycosyltransferase